MKQNKKHHKAQSFIKKVKERYGDNFTFEDLIFTNTKTAVTITCKRHGPIEVMPGNFFTCHRQGMYLLFWYQVSRSRLRGWR